MTVGELREILETEDIDDDVEVQIALQPDYPMRGRIRNVCLERNKDCDVKALWIAASGNIDYDVPEGVWSEFDIYSDDDEEEDE